MENNKIRNQRLFEFIGWMFVLLLLVFSGVILAVGGSPADSRFEELKEDINALTQQYEDFNSKSAVLRNSVQSGHIAGSPITADKKTNLDKLIQQLEQKVLELATDTASTHPLQAVRKAYVKQGNAHISSEKDLLGEIKLNTGSSNNNNGGESAPIQIELTICQDNLDQVKGKLNSAKSIVGNYLDELRGLPSTAEYNRYAKDGNNEKMVGDKVAVDNVIMLGKQQMVRIQSLLENL